MTGEIKDLIEKLTEEKASKSKLTNIEDYKAGLEAMAKALTIPVVSKCKHDCETIEDSEGFEVCVKCGEWGENC